MQQLEAVIGQDTPPRAIGNINFVAVFIDVRIIGNSFITRLLVIGNRNIIEQGRTAGLFPGFYGNQFVGRYGFMMMRKRLDELRYPYAYRQQENNQYP